MVEGVSSSFVLSILLFMATALPKLGIRVAFCWLRIFVSALAASNHLLLAAAVLGGGMTMALPAGVVFFSCSPLPQRAVVLDRVYVCVMARAWARMLDTTGGDFGGERGGGVLVPADELRYRLRRIGGEGVFFLGGDGSLGGAGGILTAVAASPSDDEHVSQVQSLSAPESSPPLVPPVAADAADGAAAGGGVGGLGRGLSRI